MRRRLLSLTARETELVEELRHCGNRGDAAAAARLHDQVLRHPAASSNVFVLNHVLQTYARCGRTADARAVFDSMRRRNAVSWTKMIAAYVHCGNAAEALRLYRGMDVVPDPFTHAAALGACSLLADLASTVEIHRRLLDSDYPGRLSDDPVLATTLLGCYAKCSRLDDARAVFDQVGRRTPVTWATMIVAYAQHRQSEDAIQLFRSMLLDGTRPDAYVFSALLNACSNIGALDVGKQLHSCVAEDKAAMSNTVVETAALSMYAKCGSLPDAESMFRSIELKDVVTWTVMMEVYVEHGRAEQCRSLFRRMNLEGLRLDKAVFISIFAALTSLASPELLAEVRAIHSWIMVTGFDLSHPQIGNSLINLYAKCGSLDDAGSTFHRMDGIRTAVSWNSMILALAMHGRNREALELYKQMDVVPQPATFTTVVSVCAALGALALPDGRAIHARILELDLLKEHTPLENALVNMYVKCGSLDDARRVFDRMHQRNAVGWTPLLIAYALKGRRTECEQLFQLMKLEGVDPDAITFLSLINACSHAGLLFQGRDYFLSMAGDYQLEPGWEHYESMVDLLARSGKLGAAEELMKSMPFQADEVGWNMVLGASRLQGDLRCAQRAARNAVEQATGDSTPYVLLSNMYAEIGPERTLENAERS